MTLTEIAQELKRIRAACRSRSPQATSNDLSRLIASIERHEKELDDEWNRILRGENLVSVEANLTYRLVK